MSNTEDDHSKIPNKPERIDTPSAHAAPGNRPSPRPHVASIMGVGEMVDFTHGPNRGPVVLRQGFKPDTWEVGPHEDLEARAHRDRLGQLRLYDTQGLVRALAAPIVLPGVNLVVEAEGWPNPFAVYLFQRPLPWNRLLELCGPTEPLESWFWVPLPMFAWRVTQVSKARRWDFLELISEMVKR